MTFVSFASAVVLPTAGLLAGMLVCIELGRWSGRRRRGMARESDGVVAASIDGAVFALLGLFMAFTFSGAMGRFDYRRSQIVDEANAIGTAYLRIDLLPSDAQPSVRPRAVSAARSAGDPATVTLIAASLNTMFDVSNARLVAGRTHVPTPVVTLLFCLALEEVLRQMGAS